RPAHPGSAKTLFVQHARIDSTSIARFDPDSRVATAPLQILARAMRPQPCAQQQPFPESQETLHHLRSTRHAACESRRLSTAAVALAQNRDRPDRALPSLRKPPPHPPPPAPSPPGLPDMRPPPPIRGNFQLMESFLASV